MLCSRGRSRYDLHHIRNTLARGEIPVSLTGSVNSKTAVTVLKRPLQMPSLELRKSSHLALALPL